MIYKMEILQHFIGNSDVEVGNCLLKFQPPTFIYFLLVAQISAARVQRVKISISFILTVRVCQTGPFLYP